MLEWNSHVMSYLHINEDENDIIFILIYEYCHTCSFHSYQKFTLSLVKLKIETFYGL